jgi:2-polyprenyl-3-methyl-5-hydroxy-6-metoxy-1,4-benzoquinol methylase
METASHITHQHLLSVIATLAREKKTLRILDAGAGPGELTRYLAAGLPQLLPAAAKIEVCGFDVGDFAEWNTQILASHIAVIQSNDPWPYPDASFDVVVSNQVLEHVADPAFFFSQLRRVLRPGGFSVHLFPLKEYLYESHVFIPLAHRFPFPAYINTMARLGFLRPVAQAEMRKFGNGNFGAGAAEYIRKYTNYLSRPELMRLVKAADLMPSFDFTPHLYLSKLRSILGMRPRYSYRHSSMIDHWGALLLFRYANCVTLTLRNLQ